MFTLFLWLVGLSINQGTKTMQRFGSWKLSLIGLAILSTTISSCGPVAAQNRPESAENVDRQPTKQADKATHDKEVLDAALQRYLDESEAALAARMTELRAFFDERKAATPGFAQAVLGTWGKFQMTGSMLANGINIVSTRFGGKRVKPLFDKFVADTFREKVLDPAMVRKAVDAAISGYRGDLAEIEARLLVSVKADIGEAELDLPKLLPGGAVIGMKQFEAVISDSVDLAVKDLGVSIGMFVASNVISDKIVEKTASKDMSKTERLVTGQAVNLAVDAALEKAIREAGYDPEKILALKVAAGIDQMSRLLIDGDPALDKLYPNLFYCRLMHPHAAVRTACNRANATLVKNANFGLVNRLSRLRYDRYRRLWTVLTTHFLGADAAKSPFLMYTPLDAAKCSPAEQIIRWADSITEAYGGTK